MVENKGNSTVLGSIRWSIIGQALSRVMMIGVSIVLARLLAPEDFGLMAMAMVIIGFMETFYELGTGSAIIQKKEISQELLSSLFYINIFFGIFFGHIVWLKWAFCCRIISG
ncbi:MAG: oligosaccharide flippase family protein [Calditrichia bacterium]